MAKTGGISINIAELTASVCGASFYSFVRTFWGAVVPETPVWNWHIRYLCDAFQADAERVFAGLPKLHDTIVNVPPGTTKSTILSVMAPAWVHARMPTARVLAASHTQLLTFELGRKSRMVERSALYRAAWPEVRPSPDQDTKSLQMNTAGGGRLACTVGGMSPTGFHAHFLLVDDPLDPQQARRTSSLEVETANAFMDEVLPSRKVDKKVAITWLIMQRLHQNDPTGHLLDKYPSKIRHICLPATKSPKVQPPGCRRRYKQGLLDPVRLSKEVLEEAEKDLGQFGYAGQYDQRPVPAGGAMFRGESIEIHETPPMAGGRWVGRCRFWDKAGTRNGGAYTVGLLMGRWRPSNAPDDGGGDEWWVLDVVRGQWDAGARERTIVSTAKADGKDVIVGIEQEPGSGGKESAQATAARLAGYRVRVIPATGSKEERADVWAVLVNQGLFHACRGPWLRVLLDELMYFPKSRYKDQVDAGSGAAAVLARPRHRAGRLG